MRQDESYNEDEEYSFQPVDSPDNVKVVDDDMHNYR